jgi:outer membrane protein insertion porin family
MITNKRICVLLFCVFATFFSQAQNYMKPQEYEIGPISIDGADNFDPQALKAISGLRQGDRVMIPGEKISNAIRKLWEENLFSDVQIYADKIIGDIVYLKIVLQTRPKLSYFSFSENVTKKEADKIRPEIDLFSGKTVSENLVTSTAFKVRSFYVEKGYYKASVNVVRKIDTLVNNSEFFFIDVDKGPKVRIKEINFYGVSDESVKIGKLKRSMKDTKTKAIWRLFKNSKFNSTAFKRDKNNVLNKFHQHGYRDAQIVKDSVYLIDDKHLRIDMYVEEGAPYYFGDIEWVGNTKFRSGYLDTILGIKSGDPFNKALLEQRLFMSEDGRDVSSLYMDRGYLFFNLTPVEMSITDDNKINYQMRMVEGKEARIRNIIIRGNTKTNEHVIRREVRTKPGDLFNRNDIIRTQRELAQLGYFNPEAFQVNPIPNPQDGTVDIEYTVEEKSSDQIELSGGYGMRRIIGTVGLSFNNFSTRNFFKKGAWQPLPSGDGQQLALRAQTNGRFFQAYNLSFTEPWLGGKKPNSFSSWLTHSQFGNNFKRNDPGYSGVSISGVGVGFGRRLKFPDDYFTAYHEISYQYYDVRTAAGGGAGGFTQFLAMNNGYSNNIAYKYMLSRNSVDNPIYPKEGSKLTFSAKATLPYSFFDGIKDYSTVEEQERLKFTEFYKFKMTGEFFFPLTKDKKLVLMPRFGFGLMGAYTQAKGIAPFERYYVGGSGLTGVGQMDGREIIALRGYNDQTVSSQFGDPIVAKYTMELRYPISLNPSATFYVLAFAEAGNTYPIINRFDPFNVKRSAGLGVRIFLPMFGMLGLDYGFGFDNLDSHSSGFGTHNSEIMNKGFRGQFHFTIGMNLGEL